MAVIGGGPAGSAAALALCRLAPGLRVVLLEAGRYRDYRPGEVVAASARAVLAELGVLQAVEGAGLKSLPAVLSAWEAPQPIERHEMFSARGPGWLVERTCFDRHLAELAAARGAEVRLDCRVGELRRRGGGWTLRLPENAALSAGFVVLATGRSWRFIRALGARLHTEDRLLGGLRLVADGEDGYPGLAVEARAD
ncbi:MAG: tryptophan 7-halogenase, partial [Kiloniellaceae bacterium]